MIWNEFEQAAPELAGAARQRLGEMRIALIGTVRRDGSPRISPIEPYFCAGQLLFGAMAWSRKATDLLRDPRFVLHSTLTGPDAGEPEVKLYGRVVEADAAMRDACPDGWWASEPDASARVFAAHVTEATLLEWDLPAAQVTARIWSSTSGLQVRQRSYP